MKHLIEIGPESLHENIDNNVNRENTRFWFGATWDSEQELYTNDQTGETVDWNVADGMDTVKLGVLLRQVSELFFFAKIAEILLIFKFSL